MSWGPRRLLKGWHCEPGKGKNQLKKPSETPVGAGDPSQISTDFALKSWVSKIKKNNID